MLRSKRLYQELINFDKEGPTKSELHDQFTDWFISTYLHRINHHIARNIEEDIVRTYLRIRLPQRVLIRYRLTSKYSGAKNRYRLPWTVCGKIKTVWANRGWSLHVCDDSVYVKKPNNVLHDVSERNNRLSPNYVIIVATIYANNKIPP